MLFEPPHLPVQSGVQGTGVVDVVVDVVVVLVVVVVVVVTGA
ncbi:MAG: hypothetical protein R2839_09260 [Thermomicrobiales bacterium]